jgi:hypothetical protein
MTPIHKLLADAGGADLIRKVWGEVPRFDGYCNIIHLQQDVSGAEEPAIMLTCLFITNESDDGNACKPSEMLIRFSEVAYWECDYDSAEENGIGLSTILGSPPSGFISVDVQGSFYIVCRKVTVLSCKHRPFTNLDDEQAGT